MDEMQVDYFRQQLLALKAELVSLSIMSHESTKPVELDQAAIGRLTRMDAMRAQAMAIAAKERGEHQLLRIESALRRIANGDFGECLVCGEDIDTRRLGVDPSYTQCITCANK